MSFRPAPEPDASIPPAAEDVDRVIDARPVELGGVAIRRVLPARALRRVGPFTFFDHMGPAVLAPGAGLDVPPHPHIGLATVTYLFEGELLHRDSLGSRQPIRPGDVNWMLAGRGIVHSERTPPELRRAGPRVHGLQLWVALPVAHEEAEPAFQHHPGATLPELERRGVRLRVLAGSAYGAAAPVRTLSPLFYVDADLSAGAELALPEEHAERAAYVVQGRVACGAERAEQGRMLVHASGAEAVLRAEGPARVILIGGAALLGERHMFWNFVASSKERLEEAKADWKAGRFPPVPGDDGAPMSLPERG